VYRRSSGARAAAPIVIRTSSAPVKHHKRRRHSGGEFGGATGGLLSKENTGLAMGALALGYLDKQGVKIPTVPILGRAGSIAVMSFFAGKQFHLPLAMKICKAAIVIAAYELGNKGTISGVSGMNTV
jgi:hypothetical protein